VAGDVPAAFDCEASELRWWTFAGGRINSTLRYALGFLQPDWAFIPDNYVIRVRGASATAGWLGEAIERLATDEFWNDAALWGAIGGSLPNYRLSKFQPLMPKWVEQETLARHLLDVPGTRRWLEEV
jgi:ATP-dependent helicase Lhr and Lhr-like helicase